MNLAKYGGISLQQEVSRPSKDTELGPFDVTADKLPQAG